ncbi:MAG: glycosyltransferase family 9 protein [Sedimentisphaerales bacterium]|nr:glycosyltransferase family 9 protein [Sedimentisphaerales bacterium]
MKILIFFASGLGDALFVGPTIFAIKELYPGAKITAVVPRLKFNRFVLEEVLPFDQILLLERPKLYSLVSILSYILRFTKLLLYIRQEKFDKAIATVQAQLPDQYLLMLLSGAKQRLGPVLWRRKRNIYRFLLTNVFGLGQREHVYYDHFSIICTLGKQLPIGRYITKVTNALYAKGERFTFVRSTGRLVVVFPGSGSQSYKRWDCINYIKVIQHLIQKYRCNVVVIGGPGEYDAKLLSERLAENEYFHDLNGRLTLTEIIWLLRQTNLVIANDNGLLHLAEFLDIHTIGIYPLMNGKYVSKKYIDGETRHIVIPTDQKSNVAEYLRCHVGRTRKMKKLCKKVLKNISPEQIILEIENHNMLFDLLD